MRLPELKTEQQTIVSLQRPDFKKILCAVLMEIIAFLLFKIMFCCKLEFLNLLFYCLIFPLFVFVCFCFQVVVNVKL